MRPDKILQRGKPTQVVSGLNPGDLVITHPDNTIHEGTRIRVKENRD